MLIDIIATLGSQAVVCLPDPQSRLMIAAMCNSVYTLFFEVGVIYFFIDLQAYLVFKHIVSCCFYSKHMRLKTHVYGTCMHVID